MTGPRSNWARGWNWAYDATMSQYRCTQCGHLLSGSEVASQSLLHQPLGATATDVVEPIDADLIVDLGTGEAETRVSTGPEPETRRNWALAGLVAAVVAFVAWTFTGGGGTDDADEADTEDAAEESGGTFGEGRPLGIPNFPPSDSHLAADAIALGFRDLIDGDERFTVVYPAADGLQMLSAAGPTTPSISVAFGFEQMARFPLISDGSRTWAVDPADPTTSYLVSTQFEVVDTALEGRVAFIDTSRDPIRVGISSFGAWGAGFEVPDSSKILAVPGRGLLIMPQTGGTFIVTATGVDPVSDDSAVAASANGEVYQRCDAALECELYVTNPDLPDGLSLDLPVGSEVAISPNGRFVTALDDDGLVYIFDTADGTSWDTGVSGVRGLGWAPDGSFLAITTDSNLLIASTVGERGVASLPLPTDPASGNVLVVSTPA